MRIVHIACVAPPETGGIGAVAAREVALLRGRGHDAVLLAPSRPGMASDAEIERVPSAFAVGHGAFMDSAALAARCAEADIVHFHYPFHGTDATIARLKAKGAIKRLAITAHMDAAAGGLKGFIFHCHRLLLQDWVMTAADAVFVSSLDYARHSSFRSLLGRAYSPLLVELPFGVDTSRFRPADAPHARKTVLFVGGMDTPHAFKGVDVLLKAIAKLPKDVDCVLAGEGDLRPGYERLAETLGIRDRVRFLGRVSEAGLPMVYREAAVLAFPSTTVAEAFGLVALEAQASGIPVVASDLPGVRTVVKQEETGLLVPPKRPADLAQALGKLLDDEEWRLRLGRRARERALAEYGWDLHTDRLLEAYGRLCALPS